MVLFQMQKHKKNIFKTDINLPGKFMISCNLNNIYTVFCSISAKSTNIGGIIGGVVGAIVGLVVVIGVIIILCREYLLTLLNKIVGSFRIIFCCTVMTWTRHIVFPRGKTSGNPGGISGINCKNPRQSC